MAAKNKITPSTRLLVLSQLLVWQLESFAMQVHYTSTMWEKDNAEATVTAFRNGTLGRKVHPRLEDCTIQEVKGYADVLCEIGEVTYEDFNLASHFDLETCQALSKVKGKKLAVGELGKIERTDEEKDKIAAEKKKAEAKAKRDAKKAPTAPATKGKAKVAPKAKAKTKDTPKKEVKKAAPKAKAKAAPKVKTPAAPKKSVEKKTATADIKPLTKVSLRKFDALLVQLSPENLTQDGELSKTATAKRKTSLTKQWKALEAVIGRTVSEEEIFSALS
jgi:chemotaxis protein histidine kinase CheA